MIPVFPFGAAAAASVVSEFDWARAAWAMIKACEEKGQGDNLRKILNSEGK